MMGTLATVLAGKKVPTFGDRFRAVRAPVLVDHEHAVLSREAAEVLGVREGDSVKVKA